MTPAIARISTPRGRVRRKNFRGGNDAPTAPLTAKSVRLPKPVRMTPSRILRSLQISWMDSSRSSPYVSRTTTISPARAPPATIRFAAIAAASPRFEWPNVTMDAARRKEAASCGWLTLGAVGACASLDACARPGVPPAGFTATGYSVPRFGLSRVGLPRPFPLRQAQGERKRWSHAGTRDQVVKRRTGKDRTQAQDERKHRSEQRARRSWLGVAAIDARR